MNTEPGTNSSSSGGSDRLRMQIYTIERGDTLSKIAQRYYGDAGQWRRIWDANRDQIDNPDVIQVGQMIQIPPQE
jgi:nucleoid-associated protein YgaU